MIFFSPSRCSFALALCSRWRLHAYVHNLFTNSVNNFGCTKVTPGDGSSFKLQMRLPPLVLLESSLLSHPDNPSVEFRS